MTKRKHPGGRPTVMTPDVIGKLEDAFMNAFTDEMACLYAGIDPTTLYDYCNLHPKFSQRKETLKQSPHLIAQKELVDGIRGNMGQARWWAEHRMPDFMPKTKVEHSGSIQTGEVVQTEEARAIGKKYEAELRATIVAGRLKKQQP